MVPAKEGTFNVLEEVYSHGRTGRSGVAFSADEG